MCGRLVHTLTPEDYAGYIDMAVPRINPNWDVRPTDALPIIRQRDGELECVLARWGFPGARPSRGSKVLFNARSETVAELPSFREAYRKRRALLFVSGWYEWKERQRYLIRRKDNKPLVMAALWQGDYFTVLTAESAGELKAYHHRMPVLLLKTDWERWLRGEQLHSGLHLIAYPSRVLHVATVEEWSRGEPA